MASQDNWIEFVGEHNQSGVWTAQYEPCGGWLAEGYQPSGHWADDAVPQESREGWDVHSHRSTAVTCKLFLSNKFK